MVKPQRIIKAQGSGADAAVDMKGNGRAVGHVKDNWLGKKRLAFTTEEEEGAWVYIYDQQDNLIDSLHIKPNVAPLWYRKNPADTFVAETGKNVEVEEYQMIVQGEYKD